MEHFRLVKEHPQFSLVGSSARVNQDSARTAGFNTLLGRGSWEEFRNLERDKAYPAGGNRVVYDVHGVSELKTYEHVEGARLVGEAEPGSTVEATLSLEATSSGRSFTYEQTAEVDENGTFAMTVPYSTTDDLGPDEGGTELSVEARSTYELSVGDDTVSVQVPEPAVLEGRTIQVPA
jgi:dolichyl-diphosphooligosaccharide--protein glycosyltransferase